VVAITDVTLSHYSCGVIKLNNGPNGWIKTSRFSCLYFGLRTVWKHSWTPGGSRYPG